MAVPNNNNQQPPHFLVVTLPAQGHINPGLQLAKRLIQLGARATFLSTVSGLGSITNHNSTIPDGLCFETFSDASGKDYMAEIKRSGSQAVADIIVSNKNKGRPFTFLVYTLFLPWAGEVARGFHVPSAMLWIQPATVLDIYHYYFYGFKEVIENTVSGGSVELPGLPATFTSLDLPWFVVPTNPNIDHIKLAFQEQMEILNEDSNPIILVNTFDSLEPEALKAIEKFRMIAVGPLLPSSAFTDGKDPMDNSSGGDLFNNLKSLNYVEWLNTKSESSVIYVSFGSGMGLSKLQTEEIAHGLLDGGRPFLWVITEKQNGHNNDDEELVISCREELERHGMIIPWCSQIQVLSHPSVGCFVTHCGWNSTIESLVSGVPVVACPQWADQGTNAKLVEDVWKTGVRVTQNNEGVIEGGEIKRCLDLVMGEEVEFRDNARKWKDLAREAAVDGGSSDQNLKTFIAELQLAVHH